MEKNKKKNWKNLGLTLIIALAVVSFWRGAWMFMDLYLFPESQLTSSIVSIILGVILLYLIKHRLDNLF